MQILSRQNKLKHKYKAKGLCVECGKPAKKKADGTLACRCEVCQRKHNLHKRDKHKEESRIKNA